MNKLKKNSILYRFLSVAIMVTLFSCCNAAPVFATESNNETRVASTRTASDGIYIYLRGVTDIASGTTVQIGTTECSDLQVAKISDTGMPIKTTILLDNSKSLSNKWGAQAKEYVKSVIDGHAEGEEFRIATFADGLSILSDYSTDYDGLKGNIDSIEYLDQDSYLTDILYELLQENSDNQEGNYVRYIIITDGADDKDIKYTQSELIDIIKNSCVVLHTIGVKTSSNNTALETLFSYARYSGGMTCLVNSDTAIEEVKTVIDNDYSLQCIRLALEEQLKDGSRKEARINLKTSDGTEKALETSVKMPFGSSENVADDNDDNKKALVTAKSSQNADADKIKDDKEKDKKELPQIETVAEKEDVKETGLNVVILCAIGLVILVTIVLVVILVIRNKKKKQANTMFTSENYMVNNSPASVQVERPMAEMPEPQKKGNTVSLAGMVMQQQGNKTVLLQSGMEQSFDKPVYITLTDINNPQRRFQAPIHTRIVIGREIGDIKIYDDGAVSRSHCEILKIGELYYINDMKSGNGTFYRETRIHDKTPIMSGEILGLGSCKYRITIDG